MNTKIKSSKHLSQEDLIELLNNEILALRIYPFESEATCRKWKDDLKMKSKLSRYSNALDVPVNRIGMTLFETENKPEKIEEYLKEGQRTIASIRAIFGAMNPLDQLINKLSMSWPPGCGIQKFSKQAMNPGIIRTFEPSPNGGLPPHVDSLLKDLPDCNDFDDMQCQLAANLYFDVCEKGGELKLWNFAPDPVQLKSMYSGSYDFIDVAKIPVSSQTLKPRIGELILFRSNCIHAVTKSETDDRSAASCFIGYYSTERPLMIWA